MKPFCKYFSLAFILLNSSLVSFAQGPTGRGGASGDDNEWLMFLIIGLVVGAVLGFLGGKFMNNSNK
ncbi:YhcB family protein [Lacihabitans sp. CS3-21]|uniref:YhcB family protein n=1 Tax=Lacihabitans sp. CS3-21 TaxID=2487332 RepID=UPI0020CD038B|nr:YhcB family protein [Lacihabitans sp. CS3-21]MCP9748959.1 hypothetical protein [Lacihabitans sp. CS3-21]